MSLHLGNLSSRVRRDELERVFRRFGRCNVQVKDKFGFVVYDIPANAEKALRTLRGKNICGQPITLSWSNRQPRPLQRFARGGRSYDLQRGRSSVREYHVNRKLGSDGRRDNRMGFKRPDADGRRFNSAEVVDESTSDHQENNNGYIGENDLNFKEDLPDESGGVNAKLLDSDRWGEQVGELSNENGVENELEFERYEPYHGDDRRDEDEIQHVTHSGGSPALKKSQEKTGIEPIGEATLNHSNNARSRQTCYICGELGHKMHNCPRENASQRKKLSRFDRKRDNEINFSGKGVDKMKSLGSKSQGMLRPGGDSILIRKHRSDRKASSSRRHRRLIRSRYSPVAKVTHRSQRMEHGEKKRNRGETKSPERRRVKKSRGPVPSPIHSDYVASRSGLRSKSSKSASGSSSHPRLESVSSRSGSPSASSSSSSISHCSRSGGSKSKSRSRASSPTSLSLSVSLGRPLPSSPNKVQTNQKNSLVNVANPDSKEVLVEPGQLLEGDAGSDNSKHENMTVKHENMAVAVENGSAVAPFKVDENMDNNAHSQRRDDDYHGVSRDSFEVKNSCTVLLEDDLTAGSWSPQSLRETRELQNSDVHAIEHMLAPTKNTESEVSRRSHTANATTITSEEIYMVLKHYGLEHPKENEKVLPVETYFGSARLWPWEIIYYRRLRKGPISTENYARRIAQNKEFGIVDKYVRSSSGWGELGEGNS